jgi:hypothetical protein
MEVLAAQIAVYMTMMMMIINQTDLHLQALRQKTIITSIKSPDDQSPENTDELPSPERRKRTQRNRERKEGEKREQKHRDRKERKRERERKREKQTGGPRRQAAAPAVDVTTIKY